MSTLIVILPAAPPATGTLCEAVLVDAGGRVVRHTQVTPNLLSAPRGAEIVALVPAQKLSWHRLQLPRGALGRGAPRLRAVLEGLLEERLLDEPARLHFALGPQAGPDGSVWVAACEQSWLQAWLGTLEQAGQGATRIVPELAPAATETSTLHVTGTPDQPQLLFASAGGVTRLPLTAATAALIGGSDMPQTVVAEPAVAEQAEQFLQGPVTLQTRSERAVIAAQSDWDLAQFELLRTRGTRLRRQLAAQGASLLLAPQWRPARWAALGLIVVNLAGLLLLAWREQAAQAAQRAAMREILTTTFPDVRVVVDAPRQMARALSALQRDKGATSGADMETMLARYQESAPDAPVASAIEFAADGLQLKGLDPAAASLAEVTARLKPLGYAARWEEDTLILKPEGMP